MKSKIVLLIFIATLLASCVPETAQQETEVISNVVAEAPATETPMTKETIIPAEPVATKTPMETPTPRPTEPPLSCVALLTPFDSADIPPVGKVTFSWTPMDEAGSYILTIILPSGKTVSFETDQTFHDRYMEAFAAGGEYRWQIVAHDSDGNEICISEIYTFEKPAFEQPNSSGNGDNNDPIDDDEPPPHGGH